MVEMIIDELYFEDLDKILVCDLPWDSLRDKSVLVTGATGLIGSCIVDLLMRLGFVNVFAMGRYEDKGKQRFSGYLDKSNFKFITHDVVDKLELDVDFDYIIHAASGAHPTEFNERPVETMTSNFLGTYNLLEYARIHSIKRFIYVSSGEVYGNANEGIISFMEDYSGYVNPVKVRSCYPSSKRATETLLVSYGNEYGIDGVIVRPCHVYGPTMTSNDSRVVAEFIRNAANGEDILLKSSGEQIRSYLYVTDAVCALFYVLFLGKSNEAYNISGDDVISIKELADVISDIFGVKVGFENYVESKFGRAVLDNSKLVSLGWKSMISLDMGLKNSVNILKKVLNG